MGAYQRTLGALDASIGVPLRNLGCDIPLFVLGRRRGKSTVIRHKRYRNLVAAVCNKFSSKLLHKLGSIIGNHRWLLDFTGGLVGIIYLLDALDGFINRLVVHLNDFFALLAISLFHRFLYLFSSLFLRYYTRNNKECSLHYNIYTRSEPDFMTELDTINHVKIELLFNNLLLNLDGYLIPGLVLIVWTVKKERSLFLNRRKHVIPLEECEIMAGDEIRPLNKIGITDHIRTETKVRSCYAPCFP